MKRQLILALGALVVLASTAAAEPLTYEFEGEVVLIGAGLAGGPFSVGQAVSGSFTIDSLAADVGGGPTFGDYRPASAGATYGAGAYAVSVTGGSVFLFDQATDQFGFFTLLASTVTGAMVNGLNPDRFGVQLSDPTGTAFSSDALPLTLPPLSAFDTTNINLSFITLTFGTAPGTRNQVRAKITGLTMVPEPGALFLLALGVFAATRRRRHA